MILSNILWTEWSIFKGQKADSVFNGRLILHPLYSGQVTFHVCKHTKLCVDIPRVHKTRHSSMELELRFFNLLHLSLMHFHTNHLYIFKPVSLGSDIARQNFVVAH